MSGSVGPVMVVDSASLYYRSFYAMPSSMRAPDGRPNGAVRGFLSTLARLIDSYAPSSIVAAWDDDWRPAWRVALVPSYKTHRVATNDGVVGDFGEDEPEELGPQVEAIASLLDAWGVPRWGIAEHEADDVAASVCAQPDLWPSGADRCLVVSGDRDLVQLISDRVRLVLTVNGGMEKWPVLDPEQATERFGVSADRYVDMAVLRGDASDGLPGVAGIGPKTAVSLIASFGSLDGVVQAAAEDPQTRPMTPRVAERVLAGVDDLQRARIVTTAVRDLRLPGPLPLLPTMAHDHDRLMEIAQEWGVERQVRELVQPLT